MEQCCAEGVDDSHGDSEAWPELMNRKEIVNPNGKMIIFYSDRSVSSSHPTSTVRVELIAMNNLQAAARVPILMS